MWIRMNIGKVLIRIAIAAIVAGAAYLIYRAVSEYSLEEIVASIRSIPARHVAGAFGFAALSYLCLTGFDYLAVRYAGKPLAYRRASLTSFCSLSIGHNVGVAALSSGAIRYRFYSRWGLSAGDVAKVVIFSGLTVGLGLVTLGGIGLLLYPGDAEGLLGLQRGAIMGMGVSCLAVPVAYLALSHFLRHPLHIRDWSIQLPPLHLAIPQVAVGTLNFACVAACLHQLMSAFADLAYLKVAATYVIGNVTALMSHVPGGLGVLEATVIYLIPGAGSLASLVAFRVIYFFVPLAFGLPLFLVSEYILSGRRRSDRPTK
jgi:glycosyltransferase 2 family protein